MTFDQLMSIDIARLIGFKNILETFSPNSHELVKVEEALHARGFYG